MSQEGAQWISDGTYGMLPVPSSPFLLLTLYPFALPAVMFETSRMLLLTDYATERAGTIHYHEPKMCTSSFSP